MNKTSKTSVFMASLLVSLMGAAFAAHAAGLGRLTVFSGIGQPLKAEVAITATPEEVSGGLAARLASHKEFSDAGIEFMPLLAGLRFAVDKTADGRPVLRLSTDAPVNEPFLHFLVELTWASGRVVREYTFLLDPPEVLQYAKPAAVATPVAPSARKEPVASPLPAPTAPKVVPVDSRGPAVEVVVKPGDTLSKIAREHKAESVSLDQMLVALFNRNREAFDGGNMNRLRAGRILRVPDAKEASGVDAGEARRLIVAQAADFNEYRRRLAAAAVAGEPAPAAAPKQEVAGKIVAEVEAKAPPAPAKDKLEVSRTETGKTADAARRSLEEDLVARDKALREAAERIAQLEKNLENLKRLVEIKSQTGAAMQQKAKEAAVPAAPAEPKPAPAEATKPAEAKPEPAPAKPPAPKRPAAPPPPPPPEPSFIEENAALVFGGGGIVALLLGYLGYSAWRRKKQARDAQRAGEESAASDAALAAGAALAVADSDAAAEISIQGDFSEGGLMTTEEKVDPVAEADVLMAYGRDAQAEEILKEGLKDDPARTAIHLKLLELYANRKDAGRFDAVAEGLRELTGGQGDDWEKAAVLAQGLGAGSALFPATVTAIETEPPVAEAAEMPAFEEAVSPAEEKGGETVILPVSPLAEAAHEPAAPAPAAVDDGALDFDLDLGTASAAAAPEAPAEAQPATEEVMSLDFDLGTPEAAPVEAEKAASAEPAAVAVEEAGGGIDFDLDLGSAEEAKVEPPSPAAESGVAETSVPRRGLGDGLDVDFDLELEASAPVVAMQEALPDSPAIDLALDEGLSADEPLEAGAGSDGDDDPEVATKLELAQAYEEMGDREGARELLNEVLNEGSAAQRAEAQSRLDRLG